jgi:hypothetical protein
MDRKKFIDEYKNASIYIDDQRKSQILKESIQSNLKDGNPAGHKNLIIVMEELAELTKEVSKELRGKGDRIGILEEMADVQIGIYYLQEILDMYEYQLNKAVNVKLDRLEKTVKKNMRKSV